MDEEDNEHTKVAARCITGIRRRTFAQAWLRNGFNKTAAAREAGFPDETAARMGQLLFETQEVKDVLRRCHDHLEKKSIVTSESIAYELDEASQLAKDTRNPSALVSAIGKKMQLYGLEAAKDLNLNLNDKTEEPKAEQSVLDEMIKKMEKEDESALTH